MFEPFQLTGPHYDRRKLMFSVLDMTKSELFYLPTTDTFGLFGHKNKELYFYSTTYNKLLSIFGHYNLSVGPMIRNSYFR